MHEVALYDPNFLDKHSGMIDQIAMKKTTKQITLTIHAKTNKDLLDFYKGLIELRNNVGILAEQIMKM
ncbi:MAG: hypothetical protein MZV64_20635 [Ignavibacteriales bacterium]|nr:hypothetical protein [Ignavibacteriales bacterium]